MAKRFVPSTATLPEQPVSAQSRGSYIHVLLANGDYVPLSFAKFPDTATAAQAYAAVSSLPTEPSYSGTGRLYYKLALDLSSLPIVRIRAGEGGPLLGRILIDPTVVLHSEKPGVPDAQAEGEALETEGGQQ